MKKTAIVLGTLLFLFTATVNAQTEPTPVKTTTDQWNNHNPDKYKLQPMPAAITLEKKFPVIGKYNLTDNSGTAADVSITLDETNKGIVWVEGLSQGKFKAILRKAPGTYKVPAQKSADDKDVAEGVLIFDKDNNSLDICIGCTYNNEDPASAFTTTETVIADQAKTIKKTTAKTKVKPVKTWKYSGSKVTDATATASVPMQ
jgi:hypothetical protein